MKILSVHIRSFGKLQNVDISFDKDMNVFQHKNGFGKTTLANFIRAMLYGFKRNTRSIKYDSANASAWVNWNSNAATGGSMTVEHNGEIYRIERTFGQSPSIVVTNVATGKVLDVGEVGEYFLGLTAESYDRSAYFPQESVEILSNENFDSRLAGLVQNAADYDKVQAQLKEYQNNLVSNRRDHAVIPDLEKQKMQLQRKLFDCTDAVSRQNEIDDRLQAIQEEREKLKVRWADCNRQIAETQKKAAQQKPTAEQSATIERLKVLKEKLVREGDFEQDKICCDDLARQIASTPPAAKVQRPISKILLIVGLLLLAAGVGVCFVHVAVGICAAVVGAVLTVLAFFVKHPMKTLQAGEQDALISDYFAVAGKYVYCKDMDYDALRKALWEKYNEYCADKREYDALSQIVVKPQGDAEQTERQLELLQNSLAQIQQSQESLSAEVGRLTEERKGLDTDVVKVREELLQMEEKLSEARHRYDIAVKVSELLERAKENLSTSYLPKLCNRTEQLLDSICAGSYKLTVDRKFALKLCENGVTKPLDNFSRGIREITLLCFRVALSELLFEGEIPFVIIDDAFVNFDEDNFLRATQLLRNLSKTTQIIYFTCHKRLGNLL